MERSPDLLDGSDLCVKRGGAGWSSEGAAITIMAITATSRGGEREVANSDDEQDGQ